MRIYKISVEEMATLTGLSVADVNKGIEYGSFGAMPEYPGYRDWETDRKSTRLNSSHITRSRMPSSA